MITALYPRLALILTEFVPSSTGGERVRPSSGRFDQNGRSAKVGFFRESKLRAWTRILSTSRLFGAIRPKMESHSATFEEVSAYCFKACDAV